MKNSYSYHEPSQKIKDLINVKCRIYKGLEFLYEVDSKVLGDLDRLENWGIL